MSHPRLPQILEALLFAAGDPLTLHALSELTDEPPANINEALLHLEKDLQNHGIQILVKDEEVTLVTSSPCAPYVERLIKDEFLGTLTKAALETLTIITYHHPIAKPEIDYIRGVNSVFTLRNLMMRGLIERLDSKREGRAYHYRPSLEFLKYLGIRSLSELPKYTEFRQEIEKSLQDLSSNATSE